MADCLANIVNQQIIVNNKINTLIRWQAAVRLLADDEAAILGDGDGNLVLLAGLEGLLAALQLVVVAVDGDLLTGLEHAVEVVGDGHGGVLRVDGGYVPLAVSCLTSQLDVLAGIAADELHVLPCHGHLLHEVDGPGGSVGDVVGSHGEVLDGSLEEDGGGEGVDVGGLAGGAAVVALRVVLVEG